MCVSHTQTHITRFIETSLWSALVGGRPEEGQVIDYNHHHDAGNNVQNEFYPNIHICSAVLERPDGSIRSKRWFLAQRPKSPIAFAASLHFIFFINQIQSIARHTMHSIRSMNWWWEFSDTVCWFAMLWWQSAILRVLNCQNARIAIGKSGKRWFGEYKCESGWMWRLSRIITFALIGNVNNENGPLEEENRIVCRIVMRFQFGCPNMCVYGWVYVCQEKRLFWLKSLEELRVLRGMEGKPMNEETVMYLSDNHGRLKLAL